MNETSSNYSRVSINDSKAGMQNIDKDKINAIITKHSQNSRYYKKQKNHENELKKKALEKLEKYSKFTQNEISNSVISANQYIIDLNDKRETNRVIVHIDMDAFYANVEIRDNQSLKDIPMAVGSESILHLTMSLESMVLEQQCLVL